MPRHSSTAPLTIIKRDGSIVPFDASKISRAVEKAMRASGEYRDGAPERVAGAVTRKLVEHSGSDTAVVPTVEGVQDLVEAELMLQKFPATAKAYILYREQHAALRKQEEGVSEEIKALVHESKQYFPNQLSEFIFYSTYSRWLDEKNRRETWAETVDRYVDFMRENLGSKLKKAEYEEIRRYMLEMKAMGSMRLLWSAGVPARASNVCVYNCSFIAPARWQDFAEIMYISMCGTGVGFSVERQTVESLPLIKRQTGKKLPDFVIGDSKEGWGDALTHGMNTWASGQDVAFDYAHVRPRGSRLKIMGGRASGPEPLKSLLDFTRERMLARQGRHLTTLDVHDIVCKIGEIVVAGGVRRSALISLSDLDDVEMRQAKNGQFYLHDPQRSMANNSAVYNEKPTMEQFLDEWHNLVTSGSGERGIFNRGSLRKQLPARRWKLFEEGYWTSGTNPCGEIVLKSKQFCNLSEVVVRPEDTEESLMEKVRIATILGTYQASLTDFPYLSPEWKKNCEEEALLGVSMTGQWDNTAVRDPQVQRRLKEVAVETNRKYAKRFGINPSTSITAVKPSGNGSQLFDCASGMHPRHAPYYIRRIRIEGHNPLKKLLEDEGVPCVPEVGQSKETATTFVLEFPVKAPAGAIVKGDLSAHDQLEYWKMLKENYCEHNPSVTVSVAADEWLSVGDWVYRHWDLVGGLSFLPKSEHVYQLAPYEEITAERYHSLAARFPAIDFSKLVLYEQADQTTGAKELACVGGVCELDLTTPELQTT
ncbi:ribonucleoside-triphosphate reductase [Candidatus Adlerbacteria bacterium RIFCSPHIGHO2_12_FULL_53_18]|uniref:Ribonucleoside-triphosphate reductase n=1 Tax=Candidatus Adlerbacteria bacterium RIFCSPHIGHO2_12_FULL_53_18 TaxID=1797242 RepID=A0A1F4XTJ4_9BACT|nr:MAG: ribonucleoside-triphosphate reductase [Candidatus Adlerbacteria bacterium RIFCSPHIGHO2_12_FULL_53_18]